MADTSSNVQFKVENGLLVLGTANIAGPAVFNGNADLNGTYLSIAANLQSNVVPVDNTYSIGNSTSRWILNAMTGNFVGAVTVTNTVASGNTTITGFANVSSTLAASNTTVTGFINVSSTANVGGATTLRDTLTVDGAVTIPNTLAVGNSTITGFANVVGTSATFNALTGVANTTDFITTSTAHGFSDGDLVRYVVAAGNTAVGGLANATNYYVVSSNSTAFKLSVSRGGSAIDLTAGVTETGHTLIPQRISLSAAGNIESPIGLANVGSLRVLGAASITGAATVNGALTVNNTAAIGNTTVTGFANISTNLIVAGNATFDIDLLFIDGTNNRIGFKNTAPTLDLISINGNTVITSANAAVRFLSTNATHNAHVSLAGNTTYSRLTVTTYEANATANDGGFLFQSVNSTATTAVLQFNQTEFKYEAGNVVHAGNFGIYDVSGTRLGP